MDTSSSGRGDACLWVGGVRGGLGGGLGDGLGGGLGLGVGIGVPGGVVAGEGGVFVVWSSTMIPWLASKRCGVVVVGVVVSEKSPSAGLSMFLWML